MYRRQFRPHAKLAIFPTMSVLFTCLLIEVMLSSKVGHGHTTPGGGYANPSMYGSYPNTNQQQWPSQQQQQQQQQYHPQNQYYDNDQYQLQQQQRQLQQTDQSSGTIEELPQPPPLPPGWSEHIDPSSGQTYYYNSIDGSTTWDRPPPPFPSANETIIDNEGMSSHEQQPQHFEASQSYSPSLQVHSNSTDNNDDMFNEGPVRVETSEHTNSESLSGINEPIRNAPFNDADALTSISRDENKIMEEEQWRESQGWNITPPPSADQFVGNHNSNTGIENDDATKMQQQPSQGWNLPPPPNQATNAWGIGGTIPTHDKAEKATINTATPTLNQSQQPKQQLRDEPMLPPNTGIETVKTTSNTPPPQLHHPPPGRNDNVNQHPPSSQHRGSESAPPMEQAAPRVNVDERSQHQIPQYEGSQQHPSRYIQQQQSPPSALSRPPPVQSHPNQHAQQQQRPGVTGQPPYPQHPGSNIYGQQPQYPDGAQRYNQYPPGRPMINQYPPPNLANPNQGFNPQAVAGQGGQLITQEQQNLVKESLGRTWQSILGLKDKTKEVVETATYTVAQSAREATQTIAEKGTGWWGQAKNVIGSVFESEPLQEYSLSGIYGNAPPAPGKQDPPRTYPMNQNYPPQSRYPSQQQYSPQGSSQQQLPPQGRYPPGYGPPQPRVDAPYPYHPQDSRQNMPPIQRQIGGNAPQATYPVQNRPYDPNRNEYNPAMLPGQQTQPPPQQQHPRNPDDTSSAWAHPGLTSDY